MINEETAQELPVTFNPALFLQRRGWVFETMTHEGVTNVVDIGCGEGETIGCLCNPAPWRAPLVIPPKDEQDNGGESQHIRDTLHVDYIHALDVSASSLKYAAEATAPVEASSNWLNYARWEPLDVMLWQGGLESFNPEFVGADCIVSTEVIEHLPENVLPEFAPMLLGVYHPRLLLITTPSYTFNARFTAPNAPENARSGFRDPTGRTNRIFRHSDHKFEWTAEEFAEWCNTTASEWGYEIEVSGVGRAQEKDEWERDDQLGWASQVATFRRRDDDAFVRARVEKSANVLERAKSRPQHRVVAQHHYQEHEMAGKPSGSKDTINKRIKEIMQKYQEAALTVHEIWFEKDITISCGGILQHLILALESDREFLLRRIGQRPLDWVIEFSGLVQEKSKQEVEAELIAEAEGPSWSPRSTGDDTFLAEWSTAGISETWRSSSSSPVNVDGKWGDGTWGTDWVADSREWETGDWKDSITVETAVQA